MKQSIYPTNSSSNEADRNIASKRRRIEINDHVEIYFYPENKEQHAHHFSDYEYENDEDENDDDNTTQEDADPSFDDLLQNFIQNFLFPKLIREMQERNKMLVTPSRRTR